MRAAPVLLAAALAAPPAGAATLSVSPPSARPGDAVWVSVEGAEAPPSGTLAGRPLAFWASGGRWHALAPLPIETPVGTAAVEVLAGQPLAAAIEVVDAGFREKALSVPPRFVDPSARAKRRIAADRRAFRRAYDRPFEPPLFDGPFDWPRRAESTGRFGDRRTFNGKQASVHYGLDLDGPVGAPVLASNGGRVVLARDCYMSGRTVILWHGAGVYSLYFHLSEIAVASGQDVARGDLVGRVGATGRVTGPHLHWSVKVDGLYVDPESILRVDPTAAPSLAAPAPEADPATAASAGADPTRR
ncbi:MAG TPA: M23 family metallopeptidase [Anaeromyxobacteraceae bacterium]|nr:M23 family metallopeptidase [Anaeromyxobacteraceae bacterium]